MADEERRSGPDEDRLYQLLGEFGVLDDVPKLRRLGKAGFLFERELESAGISISDPRVEEFLNLLRMSSLSRSSAMSWVVKVAKTELDPELRNRDTKVAEASPLSVDSTIRQVLPGDGWVDHRRKAPV